MPALSGIFLFLAASTLNAGDPNHQQYRRSTSSPVSVCAWGMSLMGKRLSSNPQLVAMSPRSSSIVNVSDDGRVERIQIPQAHLMKPSSLEDESIQNRFWPENGSYQLELSPGEEVTAVAFGVRTRELDDSRIVIGTSDGRIAVLSGNLKAEDPLVTPLQFANDGIGEVKKIRIAEDQFGFQVLVGNRASAHFIDDGSHQWNFNATASDRRFTHNNGVNDAAFGLGNTYVTVGGDNLGRVYVSRPGRQDPSNPLRLLSPDGEAVPAPNQLIKIAVAPVADTHWFVTADEHGKVLAYQRHLQGGSDKKLPTELLPGGTAIREMVFEPSADDPKLLVITADGSPKIFRFHSNSNKPKEVAFPIFERVTSAAWVSKDVLLIGTETGEVQKWDVHFPAAPKLLSRYVGHQGAIENLQVLQGRRAVMSSDTEGLVRAAPLDVIMRTQSGKVRDIP